MYTIKWENTNTEVSTYSDIDSALLGYDLEIRNTEWNSDKLYDALLLENANSELLVFASASVKLDEYGKEKTHTAEVYSVDAREDLVEKLTDIAMGTYYVDAIKTEEFLQ